MANILIVDDEVGIRELLSEILSDEGHDVQLAENAAMARNFRNDGRPDLVLLDIWMPDTDGITLLKEWSANGQLTMPVIMMSGHGTIDTAVEATRIGAIDYLEKPIALQKLLVSVKRGLLRPSLPGQSAASALSLTSLNRSVALRDLKRRIQQLAEKSRMLLLRVGPGSMAELIARSYQHHGSAWMDLSVISLPLDIKQLQNMAGGVLFVPELGKLTRAQQKNLAFAAERLDRFNLHLIVATEFSQEDLSKEGWDAKLVKYLFEVSLIPPTLADIQEDIPDLASQLLGQLIGNNEIPQRVFSQAALNSLRAQPWSGGFIELRAAVKSLALGALEEEIGIADVRRVLPPHASSSPPPSLCLDRPLREAREAFERMYFEHHLQLEGNNMTRIAEKCGLERTHLYRKLKQLGLQISRRNDDQDSRSAS